MTLKKGIIVVMLAGPGLFNSTHGTEQRDVSIQLDASTEHRYGLVMEKKVARVLKRIRHVRGLSEEERYLFARSLAATPDERWQMHETFLRSHDLYTRSSRRKYGFK